MFHWAVAAAAAAQFAASGVTELLSPGSSCVQVLLAISAWRAGVGRRILQNSSVTDQSKLILSRNRDVTERCHRNI